MTLGNRPRAMAHRLAAQLTESGLEAIPKGRGVHWHVNVGDAYGRALTIYCYWYETHATRPTLELGLSRGNDRLRPRPFPPGYNGPEYQVVLHDGDTRGLATGRHRGHAEPEVLNAARVWIEGGDVDAVHAAAPFVDAKRRNAQQLADGFAEHIPRNMQGDPTYTLTVWSPDRACTLSGDPAEGVTVTFWYVQAQVARAQDLSAQEAVSRATWWLEEGPTIAELGHAPDVELEPFAEVLEGAPARWHWLNLLERVKSPDDALAQLRPLVELLAQSPVATRFYSFSSLHNLCFSASSHYPWVSEGLPRVSPRSSGLCALNRDAPITFEEAVLAIEAALGRCPVEPFFGSDEHLQHRELAHTLAERESALSPALEQRGASYRNVLEAGARRVEFIGRTSARLMTLTQSLEIRGVSRSGLLDAVCDFLESGASLEAVAEAPAVRRARWLPS